MTEAPRQSKTTSDDETARIYVGTDRSQWLPVQVLAHSIRRHTLLPVEIRPMADLDLPEPRDVRQGKRTGFSFARFAIPSLAGYTGKALYLDADMLVFKDIGELWSIPFCGASILTQEDVPDDRQPLGKLGAPPKRIKQTSVMLLDCGALDWDPVRIIQGLDGKYTYEELVYQLCIVKENDLRSAIPYRWNSLETWDESTCLLHYTDMATQPWVSLDNKHGWLWMEELRLMLATGALDRRRVEEEVRLGYVRPSVLPQLESAVDLRKPEVGSLAALTAIDSAAGFVKHKEVYEAKERRKRAVREYERRLAESPMNRGSVTGLLRAVRRLFDQGY
jgi:hypothetical protein